MDLVTALRSIRFIGLSNVVRAIRYAWLRTRWERRCSVSPPREAFRPPGPLQEVTPSASGTRFRFSHAELEIHFLAADLVRVSWEPGTPPLPYALARTNWPEVEVRLQETAAGWRLSSDELAVTVDGEGGLRFFDAVGQLLRAEMPPQRNGEAWKHHARLQPDEHVYGLGERAASLNLRGGTFRMWNRDPAGSYGPGTDPLYMGIPVYLGLHSAGSYLIFYENPFPATFTFQGEAAAHFEGGMLRYYLVPGPPARALERYTELTGRPPLPPRWALGYHQSRWSYKREAEVRAVVEGFRAHALPLSAVHLDIDYMDGYRVFTVDQRRFPDLARMARDLEAQGVRLVVILDPGVKHDPNYPVFRKGLAEGVFCTLPDGRPLLAPVWPGWCAFPDFSDPDVRAWWGDRYADLLAMGVAGIWHDMNEPTTFAAWGEPTLPRCTRHALEGRGGDHRECHNLYGLLMNRAGYAALRRLRPQRRPFLLTRSGWAGVQRYAWHWTGDVESSWAALRQTVATVLGLALSGIPYTGPDIGGFSGAPSTELYVRWFQLATFLPFFRTHSALGTPPREPWVFGEAPLAILRTFLRLRYRLMPYLYTLAWEASQTGHPLVRPLFWPDGGSPALWDVDDAFLLGDALLVAPILEEGVRFRTVHLPQGHWYDFWNDTLLDGSRVVELEAPLERIPVLVRAGSLLPLEEGNALVLHLYPPTEGTGEAFLYTDAGDGYAEGRVDRFWIHREGGRLEVIREHEGELPLPYVEFVLRVHGMAVRKVWVDGKARPCEGPRIRVGPFERVRLE